MSKRFKTDIHIISEMSVYHTKSLRTLCCEKCALKFEEVFFTQNEKEYNLKQNISLPPFLFDEILHESRQSGNLISPKALKVCLGFRDALYWQNIDLLLDDALLLTNEDFKNMADSKIPVNKLIFNTKLVTKTMMMYLSKFASTLEYLEIGNYPKYQKLKIKAEKEGVDAVNEIYKSKIKLPKLKYLSINFSIKSWLLLDMIDLNSFSDSLITLKLINFSSYFTSTYFSNEEIAHYSKVIINAIGSYRNLKTLSLHDTNFKETDLLLKSISSLKELKTLDLSFFGCKKSSYNLDMSILISSLPKLENLELNDIRQNMVNTDKIKNKRFKYLGICWSNIETTLEADEIGNHTSLDGLLSHLAHCDNEMVRRIISEIRRMIGSHPDDVTPEQWKKLELGVLKCVNRYSYHGILFEYNLLPLVNDARIERYWSDKFRKRIQNYNQKYLKYKL